MVGLFALDLWDMVIEVLRSTKETVQPNHHGNLQTGASPILKPNKRKTKVDQLSDVVSLSCTFSKTTKL